MVEKKGDIYSLLTISKSTMHQVCYYLKNIIFLKDRQQEVGAVLVVSRYIGD